MPPTVAHLDTVDGAPRLYVSPQSTIEGLSHFDPQDEVELIEFCAQDRQAARWWFARDLHDIGTVAELMHFLAEHDHLDIIDASIRICGAGKMVTHDDGECSFTMDAEMAIAGLIASLFRGGSAELALTNILVNRGKYVHLPKSANPNVYCTFDDYLDACVR
jgi:hypothetical protein